MKPPKKDLDAVNLGRRGGTARAKVLTAKRRQEIAIIAAEARWGKRKPEELSEDQEKPVSRER